MWRAVCRVLWLAGVTFWLACSSQAEQEAQRLQTEVERLQRLESQHQLELSKREEELAAARLQLRDTNALLVGARMGILDPQQKLFATLETRFGAVVIQLLWREAPLTVQNFVELAEGTREFVDPVKGVKVRRAFYDGLTFHRLVKGFVIQGGDPLGNGNGGPGYLLPDELSPSLSHSKEGVVSMANAGRDTNGSQFFITLAPQPKLDGKYTIFGQVTQGMDVVKAMAQQSTDDKEMLVQPIRMERVRIGRGEPAK